MPFIGTRVRHCDRFATALRDSPYAHSISGEDDLAVFGPTPASRRTGDLGKLETTAAGHRHLDQRQSIVESDPLAIGREEGMDATFGIRYRLCSKIIESTQVQPRRRLTACGIDDARPVRRKRDRSSEAEARVEHLLTQMNLQPRGLQSFGGARSEKTPDEKTDDERRGSRNRQNRSARRGCHGGRFLFEPLFHQKA
jgi:hypothetical protein